MGQQQLLLVVLSVIVVGIAVVIGINMFTQGASAANVDAVVNDAVNMGARAQQFYVKPAAMGGGSRAFTGITIADIGQAANDNATYAVSLVAAEEITIIGTCNVAEKATGEAITVTAVISPTDIVTTVDN